MKKFVSYFLILFLYIFFQNEQLLGSSFVPFMKSVGLSVEKGGEFAWKSFSGIFKSIFDGAPAPDGDVYSYTVLNDTAMPIYVNTEDMHSYMGAYFPWDWNQVVVPSFSSSSPVFKKKYYFEMSIHDATTSAEPTDRLPYVNTNALYIKDCIQAPGEQNSTKMNYFRAYLGKDVAGGTYVYSQKVENLGYTYTPPTGALTTAQQADVKNAITMGSALAGLVIYNNTASDLIIGYSSKAGMTAMQQTDCDLFYGTIEQFSFGLLNPTPLQQPPAASSPSLTLPLGTLGIFIGGTTTTNVLAMPTTVMAGQQYTVEIYQDTQGYHMGFQALVAAHDVPYSRVKDVTPVPCIFWYKSAAQAKAGSSAGSGTLYDASGQIWLILMGSDPNVYFQVPLGQAVTFNLARPAIGQKCWLYCVYVATTDSGKAAQFIENIIAGTNNGQQVFQGYIDKAKTQFAAMQTSLGTQVITPGVNGAPASINPAMTGANPTITVPQSLLNMAINGMLDAQYDTIFDDSLNISGGLLGADVYLSQGMPLSSAAYYELDPSSDNTFQSTAMSKQDLPSNVPTTVAATIQQAAS